eukprot:4913014-Pleurochrysis_carterae.AAC.1
MIKSVQHRRRARKSTTANSGRSSPRWRPSRRAAQRSDAFRPKKRQNQYVVVILPGNRAY